MPRFPALQSLACSASRREFLGLSVGGVVAGVSLRTDGTPGPGTEIRVGLIGCGGRGTGAAAQAAAADPGVRIVALGDMFDDQLAAAAHVLAREVPERFACPAAARFAGADAYRRVLDAGVDAVLIAAPPHLRPLHVEAAIAAGKHLFCETPAAIDVAGALRVARALAAARCARLRVASGLHARRDERLAAVVAEVRNGAIGRPRRVDVRTPLGAPWRIPPQPGWTSVEARLRNWISDDSLSGGRFVERQVHPIDRALWVLGDRAPDVAEPLPSADGVAVRFRFADGEEIRVAPTRDVGAPTAALETVAGSQGVRDLSLAADGGRFQATMAAFLRSIRSPAAVDMDEGEILVRGSLVAIMGRTAAASGRPISWREMLEGDDLVSPVPQIGRDVNPAGV